MFLTLFLFKVFFLLSLITLSAYYFSSEKFNSTKSPSLHISFFSSPLCLTMYWYCKEKLLIDQYTGVKRVTVVSPYPEQRQNLVVHNGWSTLSAEINWLQTKKATKPLFCKLEHYFFKFHDLGYSSHGRGPRLFSQWSISKFSAISCCEENV